MIKKLTEQPSRVYRSMQIDVNFTLNQTQAFVAKNQDSENMSDDFDRRHIILMNTNVRFAEITLQLP